MSNVHICAPFPVEATLSPAICPDCGKPTRMIGIFYEWYGWDSTCLRCGRHWSDGEWMPLDFEPQARRKSVERAKRAYRAATEALRKAGEISGEGT